MGSSETTGGEPAVAVVGTGLVRQVEVVTAPSNLGLRPPAPGQEPGAARAPSALLSQGLADRLNTIAITEVPAPTYDFFGQPGTQIRNGIAIREHALRLADAVATALAASRFVVVVGGDCSVLLGCLAGARRAGRIGLVHVDGHSDFRHGGNHDAGHRLGTAAGMDLALATGRGELLLSHWPVVGRPLVNDDDVIQIGDREAVTAGPGSLPSGITRFPVEDVLRAGVARVADRAIKRLRDRGLDRVWLHVDLDVLDQRSLPAVDSPGRPGLTWDHLSQLGSRLVGTGRVAGLTVASYDPDLDPAAEYAPRVVDAIASALTTPATAAAAT
jgi:arginase